MNLVAPIASSVLDMGFALILIVRGRYPLHDDPELARRMARGEGYLGDSCRNRRETLIVSTARGVPARMVVLPGNSVMPFLLAVVQKIVSGPAVWCVLACERGTIRLGGAGAGLGVGSGLAGGRRAG